MKIKVDEEGKKVVVNLIDAALKYGGVSAFNSVSIALNAMGVAEMPDEPPTEPPAVAPQKRKRQRIKKKR